MKGCRWSVMMKSVVGICALSVIAAAVSVGAAIPDVCAMGVSLRAADGGTGSVVRTGLGYYAILPNKILLVGEVNAPDAANWKCEWTKVSGPGDVAFEKPMAPVTWATAKIPGRYEFRLAATGGGRAEDSKVVVNVYPAGGYDGNPILPGMFPDPHILFDNGTFYIYATSMENESSAYGRASVWMSKDFVNWEMKLTDWPPFGKFSGDIWAPDIMKKDGKFYQFVTRSGGYDTWIGIADHPVGPWKNLREDNTAIVSGGGNAGTIVPAYNMDAQPFIDDDGSVYMYWGWAESMAAKLTPDLKKIDGDVHFLKGTKWLPDGGKLPQWLCVDLGSSMPVTKVISCPEFKHCVYGYRIETSDDGAEWKKYADRTTNRTEKAGDGYVDSGDGKGRYVRITMDFCSGNWAGLYEFEVYSEEKLVSRGRPVTASSSRGKGSEPERAVDGSKGPYLDDYVEGSYMIKRNGTYYLMYSSGALHDGSYSVHYAMAKSPFGPFTAPPENEILCSNEEKTTKGPGHHSVLKFNDQYCIVYHQHNQPHVGSGGIFRQACADRLEFSDDGKIKKVVPTQTGVGALQPLVEQGHDVARGTYATATSVRNVNYAPEYALDHNFASLWRAVTNIYPQTLAVDLGRTCRISRVETSFEYPTLSYKYFIETSTDGKQWKMFVDNSAEFTPAVSPRKDRGNVEAAYVRITVTGCQRPENSAGIYSFRVIVQ